MRTPTQLAVVGVLWLAVAGCGGPATDAAPATLVFNHAKMPGGADPLPGLLRQFEAGHPGVSVRSESLPWTADDQHQLLVINLDGRSPGFDVMMLDIIWVAEFARAGWLLDLTPHIAREDLDAHFPVAIDAARHDGRVWALPWILNVGLLYYRADLLAKHGVGPPETYRELVDQCERIRAAERDPRLDGFLWQGKQYEGLVVNALEALWANGARLLDERGRVLPEPDRAREALALRREMIERGVSPRWLTAADEELTRRAFQDGRAIFLRSWPYAMELFAQPGSPVAGKVAIAPLPRDAHGERGFGVAGGALLGVNARTRHPELAVSLARFLAGDAGQRATADATGLYPTRRALYRDPELVRRHPQLPQLESLAMGARSRPVTPAYLMLSSALQPELSAVLVGTKTPRQALDDARRGIEHVLRGVAGAPDAVAAAR